MAAFMILVFMIFLIFEIVSLSINIISRKITYLLSHSPQNDALRHEYIELNSQLREISMTDEFAKYAKTQRKINTIKDSLAKSSKNMTSLHLKIKTILYISLYCMKGVLCILLLLRYSRIPVLSLPSDWLLPFAPILALPSCSSGEVSVIIWIQVCRSVINSTTTLVSSKLSQTHIKTD